MIFTLCALQYSLQINRSTLLSTGDGMLSIGNTPAASFPSGPTQGKGRPVQRNESLSRRRLLAKPWLPGCLLLVKPTTTRPGTPVCLPTKPYLCPTVSRTGTAERSPVCEDTKGLAS